MSIDSAKSYVERMKNDEEFRKKVLACKDAKERMGLVKAEGFKFTEKDIKVVTAGIETAKLEKYADRCEDYGERGCGFPIRLDMTYQGR